MSNIKVIEKKGLKPGKNLVILGGIHGDELCSIKAFDKIIPRLEIEFGKVIFIYSNLKAIESNNRFIEYDLNRCFLKRQSLEIAESFEGKTAKEIMPYLENADAVLDIHASFIQNSIPFVICGKSQIDKANIFDVEIVSFNWDLFEPGSTDNYMNLQNKPGFCFECGYLGDPKTQEIAEKAIFNFLIHNSCINGEFKVKENQRFLKIVDLYRNKFGPFKVARKFKDFEKLKNKTLVGWENNSPIFLDKDKFILFAKDREKINEECFLVAEDSSPL